MNRTKLPLKLTFNPNTKRRNRWFSYVSYGVKTLRIEVVYVRPKETIGNFWAAMPIADADGEIQEHVIKEMMKFEETPKSVVTKLLALAGLPELLGWTEDKSLAILDFYSDVTLEFRGIDNRFTSAGAPKPELKPKHEKRGAKQEKVAEETLKCKWFGTAPECDNSMNCFFCASYGSGYFRRSDD